MIMFTPLSLVIDEMIINLHVLCLLMKDKIFSNEDGFLVIKTHRH